MHFAIVTENGYGLARFFHFMSFSDLRGTYMIRMERMKKKSSLVIKL